MDLSAVIYVLAFASAFMAMQSVLGFGKTEYAAHGLRCSTELGPDEGAATAVYAGFDFRRRYVRETLSGDVSEALLESAVPFSQLADQPAGAGVESFKMKPSFAYAQRLCERLPGAAPRCAEMRRDAPRGAERSREEPRGAEAPRCDETRAATLLAASLPAASLRRPREALPA